MQSEAAAARVAAEAGYRAAGATWMRTPAPAPQPAGVIDAVPMRFERLLHLLTDDERAVVLRVQQGMRNREIAASLFVSQRTVELRLTNVYRKLGARSRAHLVAMLA
jgi:DNA-binding NarL/FixJ family response regulator